MLHTSICIYDASIYLHIRVSQAGFLAWWTINNHQNGQIRSDLKISLEFERFVMDHIYWPLLLIWQSGDLMTDMISHGWFWFAPRREYSQHFQPRSFCKCSSQPQASSKSSLETLQFRTIWIWWSPGRFDISVSVRQLYIANCGPSDWCQSGFKSGRLFIFLWHDMCMASPRSLSVNQKSHSIQEHISMLG